jgi:hypothetical protein
MTSHIDTRTSPVLPPFSFAPYYGANVGRKSDFCPTFAPVDLYRGPGTTKYRKWYHTPPAPPPPPLLLLLSSYLSTMDEAEAPPPAAPPVLPLLPSDRQIVQVANCDVALCILQGQSRISLQTGGGLRSSSCCGSRSLPLLVHFTPPSGDGQPWRLGLRRRRFVSARRFAAGGMAEKRADE